MSCRGEHGHSPPNTVSKYVLLRWALPTGVCPTRAWTDGSGEIIGTPASSAGHPDCTNASSVIGFIELYAASLHVPSTHRGVHDCPSATARSCALVGML